MPFTKDQPKSKLTEAQYVALQFVARICASPEFGHEVHGVHPRRGQSQMFERLRLMGLLADAGVGVDVDDHERESQLYTITDAGRAALVTMPSTIDQRRLNDGAAAITVSDREPATVDEVRRQISAVRDGIAALQSLDALGVEANERAWRDEQELWKRLKALEQHLKQLEGKALA